MIVLFGYLNAFNRIKKGAWGEEDRGVRGIDKQ